jgi:hypothetical protein
VSNPQSQTLEAFRYRPVVSAVLIVLLGLLIFAARGHQGEDRSLGYWSTVESWETSAVISTDQPVPGS